MKNYIIGIALALALVMGVVAFAETADPVPAVTEEAPTEDAAPEAPAACGYREGSTDRRCLRRSA